MTTKHVIATYRMNISIHGWITVWNWTPPVMRDPWCHTFCDMSISPWVNTIHCHIWFIIYPYHLWITSECSHAWLPLCCEHYCQYRIELNLEKYEYVDTTADTARRRPPMTFWNNMYVKAMALCKTAVTPLLTHWDNCSLALSHRRKFAQTDITMYHYRFVSNCLLVPLPTCTRSFNDLQR